MDKKFTVTVGISTKDRYFTTLPQAIMTVIHQTYVPDRLIIFDDGEQKDLRNESLYQCLFHLLTHKGIAWEVCFGKRIGQVANHQMTIDMAKTDLIWRIDDDDWAPHDTLEKLVAAMEDDVAVTSGLVWIPGSPYLSAKVCSSKIEDLWIKPNLQWGDLKVKTDVDHMHNSFLFRREAAKHGYPMNLSPVGHGEESLFTYGFKRDGWRLVIDPSVVIWHLKSPTGGIRSYQDSALWAHDAEITQRQLDIWGVKRAKYKLIVLDCGLGDHYAFKMALPDILAKYKDHHVQLAVCYPEVFKDDPVELLSIYEASMIDPDQAKYNVYKWGWDHNWQGNLVDAFKAMYL